METNQIPINLQMDKHTMQYYSDLRNPVTIILENIMLGEISPSQKTAITLIVVKFTGVT